MYKLNPFSYSFSKSGKSKKIFLDSPMTFEKNDTIAIIGPSGGGKSTLLKILKGIIPEYSSGVLKGEILFNEAPLDGENFKANLQKILYLFQNPFSQLIYPTTEEEFLFSMENFNFSKERMDKEKEHFEKLLGLKNIWGKKTSELSNGECQKLVLASLLAIGPEVLLLDEPTAFLDQEARREFYRYLNLIKKDRIVIIVDHHVEEIKPLVNKVVYVSSEGRISAGEFHKERTHPRALSLGEVKTHYQAQLTVSGINFSYDNKRAILNNANASFESGQIVALKGKNGEGKSTFFKLLSGILNPTSGSCKLTLGQKTYLNKKIFQHVGFVFQNPENHFFFDTIREELNQSFKLNLENKDEMIRRFFHEIELEKSPFLLSEGEKRRLSILMTVFLGKEVVLFDEPTFGQDRASIEEIILLMKELKKWGIIQVFISHDDYFIEQVADRVMVLDSGSLNEIS